MKVEIINNTQIRRLILIFLLIATINFYTYSFLKIPIIQAEAPPEKVAYVTRSLWSTGSLEAPEFLELAKIWSNQAKSGKEVFWQDAFSLGWNGKLYPKHSVITAVMAVPFYGIFGEVGFLIFQTLVVALSMFFVQLYFSVYLDRDLTFFSIFAFSFLTQIFIGFYYYFFGYDLHGALLILAGYILSDRFPFFGNFLYPLSVFVRPSHVLLFPFLFIGQEKIIQKKHFIRSLFGLSLGVGVYLVYNYFMWGSIFLSSYHRIPYFDTNGDMFISEHPIGFNFLGLKENLFDRLFSLRYGLLTTNLSFLALPFVLWRIKYSRHKRQLISLLLGVFFYSGYIFSYNYMDDFGVGNRFLLPVIFIYLLCLGVVIGEFKKSKI